MITRPNLQIGKVPYSVLMYKDGDIYVAEDYSSTVIKEHTTDAGIVLQAAINSLPSGGHIAVRKAVYPVLSSIEINKSDLNISGEGLHNTCFRLNTNLSSFIKIGTEKENIILENLNFHANNNVATAIDASRATTFPYRMVMRHCNIYGATSKNVNVTNREEVQISDCHIGDQTQSSPYNVYQDGSGGWLRITDGSILHNASTYSIYFKGSLLSIVNADLHVKSGANGHLYAANGSVSLSNAWTENGTIRGVVGGGSWCNFASACSFLNGGLGGSYTSVQMHGDKLWTSGFAHDVDITVNATRGLYGNMTLDGSHTFSITGKYRFYEVYAGVLQSSW